MEGVQDGMEVLQWWVQAHVVGHEDGHGHAVAYTAQHSTAQQAVVGMSAPTKVDVNARGHEGDKTRC